jgi:aminopeptidase N
VGKISQVVVRDYVSGAMENTSAVLHGEFIQQDDHEYLDNTYEDVISQ